MTELSAPVVVSSDYSVSAELWQQLEDEIKLVSARIESGEDMVPEDVAKVRTLKTQVENYVTAFNKATRDAQSKYRRLIDERLAELGFPRIETFIAKKREEQTRLVDDRIRAKMDTLRNLTAGLLARTKVLKETVIAKELLPAFTARFPKIQSGAKTADIKNWTPYYLIVSHTIEVLDAFFQDPAFQDAVLLPIHSCTMRELLSYVRDGSAEHLTKMQALFEVDKPLLHAEMLRKNMAGRDDGLRYIADILARLGNISEADEAQKQRIWDDIVLTVHLLQ